MQLELTYLYSMEHFFTFFTLKLQIVPALTHFCNLTSNERSLETGQVIKMSLKLNERYDLNS